MTARPQSDDSDIWLVNLPPTPLQSRMALGVAVVLLVGLGVTARFGDVRLPPIDAFIPAIAGAVILTGLDHRGFFIFAVLAL